MKSAAQGAKISLFRQRRKNGERKRKRKRRKVEQQKGNLGKWSQVAMAAPQKANFLPWGVSKLASRGRGRAALKSAGKIWFALLQTQPIYSLSHLFSPSLYLYLDLLSLSLSLSLPRDMRDI
jgi:hypothetical protein